MNIRLVSFPGLKPIADFILRNEVHPEQVSFLPQRQPRETTMNKSFWLDGAYIYY